MYQNLEVIWYYCIHKLVLQGRAYHAEWYLFTNDLTVPNQQTCMHIYAMKARLRAHACDTVPTNNITRGGPNQPTKLDQELRRGRQIKTNHQQLRSRRRAGAPERVERLGGLPAQHELVVHRRQERAD